MRNEVFNILQKMKRNILWIIAIAAVIIFLVLYVAIPNLLGYAFALKTNWNIALPSGYAEVYSYSESSFHGDGIRYHVLDYPADNEEEKWQNKISQIEELFYNAESPSLQEIEIVQQWLDSVDIQGDVIPEFSVCRVIHRSQADGSELHLFWWGGTGTIYSVESFI